MRRHSAFAAALAAALLASPAARAAGMPQLDFGNPLMLAQLVWLAIIFVVLYLLLSNWALPQVQGVLAQRAATIGSDIDIARAAKAEADAAVAELTEATRDAQAKSQAEIAAATTKSRAEQAARAADMAARLDLQLAAAERQIAEARQGAMAALRDVAGETATLLVTRLTGRAPDPHTVHSAVADALIQTN